MVEVVGSKEEEKMTQRLVELYGGENYDSLQNKQTDLLKDPIRNKIMLKEVRLKLMNISDSALNVIKEDQKEGIGIKEQLRIQEYLLKQKKQK